MTEIGSGPLRAADYAERARATLSRTAWDYVDGGSGDEHTVAANLRAYADVRLTNRVLVDVSRPDASTTLLGTPVGMPVGVAPTAYQQLIHPDAEVGMVRGAGAAGALFVLSFFSTRTIEEVAAAATGPLWMQLYWLKERSSLVDTARRAEAAGFRALVLTVDAPQIGRRWRDIRNGFAIPETMRAVNIDPSLTAGTHSATPGESALTAHAARTFDTTITWDDLAWLRGLTDLPLLVKGILTAEDAARAISHGAAGVVVSNHGGRQLDGALASLHALPAVVDEVAGRGLVLVDGGIRDGRDAYVALCLGADAVLLGRSPMWALAAGGADAVAAYLTDFHTELLHTMTLAGRPRLADLDRSAIVGAATPGGAATPAGAATLATAGPALGAPAGAGMPNAAALHAAR